MTYAPQSKDNSNPQHQQQTTKATAQTFSDNRESIAASLPLQAMMANSSQQQKIKSTAQLMANSPAQQKLNTIAQNFANKFEPAQRLEDEEPLQGKFETESEPAQLEAAPEAPRPNNTGLPDNLKSGIENLSGMSMDHVRVHYNSDKPAQLQAHAYAQGSDIHVSPGQEQHLPHEAWHVVQQAQGRVKPTMQMKGDVQVNDDVGLENEADVMGARALQVKTNSNSAYSTNAAAIAQRKLDMVVQRYRVSGVEEEYPEGSVTASKSEIFAWLDGQELWSKVETEWCLIGGSAHVEIVEHLLSSNFDGVVKALVSAMGIVPPTDTETTEEYVDFFVHEVMTTEDLDIAVSNPIVAKSFPANQATVKRLLCPAYAKPSVDLLMDPGAMGDRFKLPNGVWVVAPKSLIGKPQGGRAGILAAISAKKTEAEQSEGKGRKRTARHELMKSVLEQKLLDQN